MSEREATQGRHTRGARTEKRRSDHRFNKSRQYARDRTGGSGGNPGGDSVTAAWEARSGLDDPLRPFTSTAQVPAVGAGPYLGAGGGELSLANRPRPAPLGLRLAVWGTALLVAAGLVLIGVHQAYPSWLKAAPARHGAPAAAGSITKAPNHSASRGSGTTPPASSGPVSLTPSGPAAGTVSVDSARYSVEVVAGGRCWVQVTAPGSASPLFASVMAAGAQQTFQAANGKLTLELGASMVTVQVLLPSQRSPAWQWTPPAAPYQLSFTSKAG